MRLLILFIMILFVGFGCSSDSNTDTPAQANPDSPESGDPTPLFPTSLFTYKIYNNACQIISNCHGVTQLECETAWLQLTGVGLRIGIVGSDPLQDIAQDENDGLITPAEPAATTCLAELNALTCADPNVATGAYNSGLSNPYLAGYLMLPASCTSVF